MMKKNISYDINQEHLSLASSASKFEGPWKCLLLLWRQ